MHYEKTYTWNTMSHSHGGNSASLFFRFDAFLTYTKGRPFDLRPTFLVHTPQEDTFDATGDRRLVATITPKAIKPLCKERKWATGSNLAQNVILRGIKPDLAYQIEAKPGEINVWELVRGKEKAQVEKESRLRREFRERAKARKEAKDGQ